MKPVIEANFKPFESVRFRQNARLVSKDQLAAKQHQAISQYRLKARQAHNYGISSPESMTCFQDIRQAFVSRILSKEYIAQQMSLDQETALVIHFLAALTIMGCIPFREVNLNFVWHLAIWNTYQPWK